MPLQPFILEKQYRDYIWGGDRLRPGHSPTAEVWAIHENNTVIGGDYAGRLLTSIATELGTDLLGTRVTTRIGSHFPVLIKLLDCNQWLSLQVHPNDEQVRELKGAGFFGKTEAWYFLDTVNNAEILCGTKDGVTKADIVRSVRDGTILDCANRVPVTTGDHVLIPAGSIHALGPGMLVFEVQESSDITYRVFDWNRPASEGRELHIEQSIRVIDPGIRVKVSTAPIDSPIARLESCEYFSLDKLVPEDSDIIAHPAGESFHALTVISGEASVKGDGWSFGLSQYDSLLVPASCEEYRIEKQSGCELLRVTA